MEILNATDAKREFGEVLLKAQNQPVGINKNGKPVAVVVSASEYEELEAIRDEWLRLELLKGMVNLRAGQVSDGKSVIDRLRNRIINATL